jgi:hypothetical protein
VIGTAVVAVTVESPAAQAVTTGNTELIRSYPTGLCLDVDDQGGVHSGECNFGPSQYWREAPSMRLSDADRQSGAAAYANEFSLLNRKNDLCLEDTGGAVSTKTCVPQNANQTWIHVVPQMQPGRVPPGEDAWPAIYENFATHLCLVTGNNGIPPRTVVCSGGDWATNMYFRRGY